MDHTKAKKITATEVQITRVTLGLVFFLAIAASIWAVNRYRKVIGGYMPVIAGVCVAVAAVFIVLTAIAVQQKRDLKQRLFSVSYLCFLTSVLAAEQVFLYLTMPGSYWEYSRPMAYVSLIVIFILYAAALPLGGDFFRFGILEAALGMGGMAVYQNYFSAKQQIIFTQLLPFKTVCRIGWGVLAAIAACLLVLRWKKRVNRIWKDWIALAFAAIYWISLSHKWLSGQLLTWIFAGVLAGWFLLLCVLKHCKVIG